MITWKKYLLGAAGGILFLLASAAALNVVMGLMIHGRKTVMVPELTGKSLGEGLDLLSATGLALAKSGVAVDLAVPAGSIVSHTPAAGTMVRAGRVVRVVVSQGGRRVMVPDLRDEPIREAELRLRQAGLALGETRSAFSLRVEKDKIIDQEPAPRAMVDRDTLVSLTISGGAPPSGMTLTPDFVGRSVMETRQWAAEAGVHLTELPGRPLAGIAEGTVIAQSVKPDSPAPGDRQVTVTVAPAAGPNAPAVRTVYYELAQGESDREVRMVLENQAGRREIFRENRSPGSKITVPVLSPGRARVRIYLNQVLVEERDVP